MSGANWLTATEISAAYAARRLSPVELVQSLLDRIATHDHQLNAFIKVDAEGALDAGFCRSKRKRQCEQCLISAKVSSTVP